MKISKISLLAILAVGALTAFGTVAQAQDANTNTPPAGAPGKLSPQQRLEKLDQDLGLTGDVKTKFDAIMKDQAEQMKALSPEDRKTKGKDIRDTTNEKVKAILTADQYTKYLDLTKRHAKKPAPDSTPN